MLAKKADVNRIYLPCQEGRRSLMNLGKEYKTTMVGLHKYMMNKEDPQIKAVLRHQTAKALHSILQEAEAYLTETGTKDLITNDLPKSAAWKAKKVKLKYKEDISKLMKNRWKEKVMHGKLPRYLEKDHVDQEISFQWMKYTGLKGETCTIPVPVIVLCLSTIFVCNINSSELHFKSVALRLQYSDRAPEAVTLHWLNQ